MSERTHAHAADSANLGRFNRRRNTGNLDRSLDHFDGHQIGLQILNLDVDTKTLAGREAHRRTTGLGI